MQAQISTVTSSTTCTGGSQTRSHQQTTSNNSKLTIYIFADESPCTTKESQRSTSSGYTISDDTPMEHIFDKPRKYTCIRHFKLCRPEAKSEVRLGFTEKIVEKKGIHVLPSKYLDRQLYLPLPWCKWLPCHCPFRQTLIVVHRTPIPVLLWLRL